jgi:Bacterial antitoxin of type II TA system, VapB
LVCFLKVCLRVLLVSSNKVDFTRIRQALLTMCIPGRNIRIMRTNIMIDDDLLAAALEARPNSTKRAVVEEGLRFGGACSSSEESGFVTRETTMGWRPRNNETRPSLLSDRFLRGLKEVLADCNSHPAVAGAIRGRRNIPRRFYFVRTCNPKYKVAWVSPTKSRPAVKSRFRCSASL